MNILLLGSGGREHALAWKIKQSPRCKKLWVAPGNAGIRNLADTVAISTTDFDAIEKFCVAQAIDLVVVGPEAPLVAGIRDVLKKNPALQKIRIIGPGQDGARLEGSKVFSKQFMLRHHIPTAQAAVFTSRQQADAEQFIHRASFPLVIKADGLASGKGVIIAQSEAHALQTLHQFWKEKQFGEAGEQVLLEEFLSGIELSVFILTDGKNYCLLPTAKDYKRIGEHDTGLNTGGMGAVSPVPFADDVFMQQVKSAVIEPTLRGLQAEKISFNGFLFIGLMKVGNVPYVIEYNVRMGDPETQSVMSLIENDMVDLLVAVEDGTLAQQKISIQQQYAITVVMAAQGYPEEFRRGDDITGLNNVQHAQVFHSGTMDEQEKIKTNGGRVLAVTSVGTTLEQARERVYADVKKINWTGAYYRNDIGVDLLPFVLNKP